MPLGADAVAMKEDTELQGDRVRFSKVVALGQHLRRAGEDVAVGEKVLACGQVLAPGALALAAALGQSQLLVRPRPTVAIFTSGDELRPPGQPLVPGEIHDSNRVLLQTLLLAEGFQPVAWPVLPDDPARIAAALKDAAESFDLVLTCGGVSAGERDYLPAFMAEQGEVHFWRVKMRPGMPVLAGRLGRAQIICLPGNPVSVLATYLALARRLLDGMQGRQVPRPIWKAKLATSFSKRHDRLEFLRGQLRQDEQGVLWVEPNPADGSHRLRAVADSNALVVLPEGVAEWPVGALLDVLPLPGG
jgi:molybdopterin molybdotransferase